MEPEKRIGADGSEQIIGTLQKVQAPCLRCNQDVTGFLIPDGRFICPKCDPPAVYDRWNRVWEPHIKEHNRQKLAEEQAAKKEAEMHRRFAEEATAKREKEATDTLIENAREQAIANAPEPEPLTQEQIDIINRKSERNNLIGFLLILGAGFFVFGPIVPIVGMCVLIVSMAFRMTNKS